MNANTLKAITRHGETLLAAFPNAIERDPVALCKKLRRIEVATSLVMEHYCNGIATLEDADCAANLAKTRLQKLLYGPNDKSSNRLYINRDPRGYALKLNDVWTRGWNQARYAAKLPALYTDMGGYGILAPDLTEDNR